ncbi:uncharacterized protein LOC109807795 [Cajanus cajan]|uniref:uncharacterized protein LOC109807795 n=1 Tax=Cajanus cajan TaxID=3821 RepID=UPI00098D7A9C|nr:uncharacterized protein LOC109807795 [Cajanus cajan]
MDPSQKRVLTDDGTNNGGDGGRLLNVSKLFRTYFAVFDHGEEGEKKSEEVGETTSMEVDEVAADEDCVDVGGKEEKGKANDAMGDNNEGLGGVEEGMEVESNEVVEDETVVMDENSGFSSNPRKMLDFDLNEMPPEEDSE